MRGVVKELIHDAAAAARRSRRCSSTTRTASRKDNYQWTATEGTYSGQFIYCRKEGCGAGLRPLCARPRALWLCAPRRMFRLAARRSRALTLTPRNPAATLVPGNILPLEAMPPGTVINNVEKQAGDRSKFAKTSGGFAQIIGHVEGKGLTRVRLPTGAEEDDLVAGARVDRHHRGRRPSSTSRCSRRARLPQIQGEAQRRPKVRGVAMNPVEHPARRREPPAHRPPVDGAPRLGAGAARSASSPRAARASSAAASRSTTRRRSDRAASAVSLLRVRLVCAWQCARSASSLFGQ